MNWLRRALYAAAIAALALPFVLRTDYHWCVFSFGGHTVRTPLCTREYTGYGLILERKELSLAVLAGSALLLLGTSFLRERPAVRTLGRCLRVTVCLNALFSLWFAATGRTELWVVSENRWLVGVWVLGVFWVTLALWEIVRAARERTV